MHCPGNHLILIELQYGNVKYKLSIFTSANLTYWAGVEKALYYYCLYAPDDFQIQIINNPYHAKVNIAPESIKSLFYKACITELDLCTWKISTIYPRLFEFFLRSVVLERLLVHIDSIFHRKAIKDILNDADLVYLVKNSFSAYVPKCGARPIVIGSEHVYDFYSLGESGIVKGIIFKLLNLNFINRGMDKIHLISNASLSLYRNNSKFFCAQNGVDTALFQPSDKLHCGKVKLLFVSRLEVSKGIIDVIDAFNEIDNENFELYIAGNGSLYDSVKAQENEKIHVLGFVDEVELRRLFSDSDILIFPTKAESFPLVLLEALSSGLFVLASDILRMKFHEFQVLNCIDFIAPDRDGVINGIKSAESKIDTIRNLERKNNAHKFMEENYDWKIVVEKLFSQFRSFIDQT